MTRNDKREAPFGFSPGPLMSEREVAEYLKVSVRTIVNWKQRGLIPYFRIGRTIRYSREQIDQALMERHQCNAAALST
jgi:excisionase family DNA binding protein